MPPDMPNFTNCVISFRATMLNVYQSPACSLTFFHLSFQLGISFKYCLSCTTLHFPCNFLSLMWLSLLNLCPLTGPFIFKVLGYPYPSALMLHRIVFIFMVRCWPCMWLIAPLKLIYVTKMVQCFYVFPD